MQAPKAKIQILYLKPRPLSGVTDLFLFFRLDNHRLTENCLRNKKSLPSQLGSVQRGSIVITVPLTAIETAFSLLWWDSKWAVVLLSISYIPACVGLPRKPRQDVQISLAWGPASWISAFTPGLSGPAWLPALPAHPCGGATAQQLLLVCIVMIYGIIYTSSYLHILPKEDV